MKINIIETAKLKKEVDVNFPIYRKHILDQSTIYTKVESLEKEVSIHIYDNEQKFEYEVSVPYFWGSENYLLGKGEHSLIEKDFIKALFLIKELINNY